MQHLLMGGSLHLMAGAVACSMAMVASGIPSSPRSEQGRGKISCLAISPPKHV